MSSSPSAAAQSCATERNPLLEETVFPQYDRVKPEHVLPGMQSLLADINGQLDDLEGSVQPTWSQLVDPLEKMSDSRNRIWGVVQHLKMVQDTEALRKAYDDVQPDNVKLSLRMAQSRPLYEAYKALRSGSEWESLPPARKRIVESEIRDFVLGGVALEGDAKARFNEIQQELTQLSTDFSNHVLDATKAFKKLITNRSDLDGLPATTLGLAAQSAVREGHAEATAEAGPWLLTLDFPCYQPVLTHAKNRSLREEMYRAFVTRASSGETDNTPLINRILALRQEKAQLLGYENFAEVSMASKMATLPAALSLMEELRVASLPAAQRDLEEVQAFARSQGCQEELLWWDTTFWAERLREDKYNITDEELRPYFSLPAVLEGLFKLLKRLFNVDVVPADGEAPVWHGDVRFFKVLKNGTTKAFFYLDPYSRPAEKQGGAWMAPVVGQSALLAPEGQPRRLPVAHMVCNQSPPVGDQPSLMTFRDVETLFHEAGHALQHMLTTVDDGQVSGINGIEWDAVELPSQFMENWCYDERTLYSFARHYATGEPLPKPLFQRLRAAKTYRAGSMMLRQLHFSLLDLQLHSVYRSDSGKSVFDYDQELAKSTMVTPPFPDDRFLCAFRHIFAGGYSAGYFSYKWAEVLSADAFSAFEDVGLENEDEVQATGQRFLDTVMALGGSVAPAEVFKMFRGREPDTQALLRHADLLVAA